MANHINALRMIAVRRARSHETCLLLSIWGTLTLHWRKGTRPAALGLFRIGTAACLAIHFACENYLSVSPEVSVLNLWLIILVIWLAPALVVCALLFWHVKRLPGPSEPTVGAHNDPPPAE